jgi:hypothetical protein
MSGYTHTPGPWFLDPERPFVVQAPDATDYPWKVADVASDCGSGDQPIANARLVAAAPDLLEALQEIIAGADPDCGEPVCPDCTPWRRARTAISRALGETQKKEGEA